ncbi:hypothetical protein K501DRAFT_22438 [Backusella circina FSU 941]|nr:hypothetical protein K501DRAFT_22438 [Backusella circina FSU 941]
MYCVSINPNYPLSTVGTIFPGGSANNANSEPVLSTQFSFSFPTSSPSTAQSGGSQQPSASTPQNGTAGLILLLKHVINIRR